VGVFVTVVIVRTGVFVTYPLASHFYASSMLGPQKPEIISTMPRGQDDSNSLLPHYRTPLSTVREICMTEVLMPISSHARLFALPDLRTEADDDLSAK